jgi:hypothetical protein
VVARGRQRRIVRHARRHDNRHAVRGHAQVQHRTAACRQLERQHERAVRHRPHACRHPRARPLGAQQASAHGYEQRGFSELLIAELQVEPLRRGASGFQCIAQPERRTRQAEVRRRAADGDEFGIAVPDLLEAGPAGGVLEPGDCVRAMHQRRIGIDLDGVRGGQAGNGPAGQPERTGGDNPGGPFHMEPDHSTDRRARRLRAYRHARRLARTVMQVRWRRAPDTMCA